MEEKENDVELMRLLEEVVVGEFKPFARFDSQLDCVRVLTEDCSFTEEYWNQFITMARRNHVDGIQYVGFTI